MVLVLVVDVVVILDVVLVVVVVGLGYMAKKKIPDLFSHKSDLRFKSIFSTSLSPLLHFSTCDSPQAWLSQS